MDSQANLYILKHKDLDVAMALVDSLSGKIEYVLDIYMPEELPVGCKDESELIKWWESRAIPDSRRGIQQILKSLGEQTNLSLMLSAYGLSLTDHYWMQPVGKELYWSDLNFYENDFSDELGCLLTDSDKVDIDAHISKFSPSSSVTGEMKKKWVLRDGSRYLMKVNVNDYGQQSVNEVIASRLHERLGWKNYISYEIERAVIEGIEVPCSLNQLFTSEVTEFVSAYQLVKNYKVQNDTSVYETVIQQAVELGLQEREVRRQLEYTIMTDFLLSNTDRHFNNFGFLYDPVSHRLVSMAPIFDTGNALFYDREIIPTGANLLNIRVASFSDQEVKLLRYVTDKHMIELDGLQGFAMEAVDLLKAHTQMPAKRAEDIGYTIEQKIELLRKFQQGQKIWKPEKYW